MEYDVERIEKMFEFAEKYPRNRMKESLKVFVRDNLDQIISNQRFLSSGKPFVEFMSSINQCSQKEKESVFEAVYKWTENQVLKHKDAEDENFNLIVAVKDELSVAFPHIFDMDKSAMDYDFLMNFMVKKGLFLSPNELELIYESYGNYTDDIRFKIIKEQALQRQKLASDSENFGLVHSIKADLSEVIKIAKFYEMDNSYLMDFVVAEGFITAEQVRHTRVSIENNNGKVVGVFEDSLHIRRAIQQNSKYSIHRRSTTLRSFLDLVRFNVPKTAS
uniref:BACK domain-containing protein n=1 Tax=Panagrolaimus sp. PS1159 TaxID=55785 RepID=A0AC35GNA6_9BILA